MSKFVEMFDDGLEKSLERRPSMTTRVTITEVSEDDRSSIASIDPMPRWRFVGVVITALLYVFVFVLDQLTLATSVGVIADHFDALDRVSWLVNASFLTLFAFNLAYAQCLAHVSTKHLGLFTLTTFTVGQLIAALAPSLAVLLVGRAIVGIGAAGMYSVAIMLLTETVAPKDRATYLSMIGVAFTAAFLVGPLLGGTMTRMLSWRWSFYLSVPIDVLAGALTLFLVKPRAPIGHEQTYAGLTWTTLKRVAYGCDWLGVLLCLAWGACVLVALENGGGVWRWDAPLEVTGLVCAGVLPVLFVLWEAHLAEHAMLRIVLLRNRNVSAVVFMNTTVFASYSAMMYFFAETLRALYNISPVLSGVQLMPFVAGNVIGLMGSWYFLRRTGIAWPILLGGPVTIVIGSTALSRVGPGVPLAYTLGVSVLNGLGIGLVSQTLLVVVQNEYGRRAPDMLAAASGAVVFFSNLGRLLGTAVGSCLFARHIARNLDRDAPTLPPALRLSLVHRADGIWTQIEEPLRGQVVRAFGQSLDVVYLASASFAAVSLFGALMVRRVRLDHDHENDHANDTV